MRALKKLDYFRKTDQKNKTRIGGIVSLLSVGVSSLNNSSKPLCRLLFSLRTPKFWTLLSL